MLHEEHSAILSTFIKLPFAIRIFVWSIFEWLLKTGFTVLLANHALGTMNPGIVSLGPLGTYHALGTMNPGSVSLGPLGTYHALGTMNPGSVSLGPLGTFMSVTNMGEKNTPIHSS